MTDSNILANIDTLSQRIAANPHDAEALYERGRLYWRLEKRGAAMSDYEAAAALGYAPATEALRISHDIMNFYNTDLYNP